MPDLSFVSNNKNHCYCNFLCFNFPTSNCFKIAHVFKNFGNKFYFGTCHKILLSTISYRCFD